MTLWCQVLLNECANITELLSCKNFLIPILVNIKDDINLLKC